MRVIRNIIRDEQEPADVERKIREKFFGISQKKELYFIMGTHFIYGTWMITGIFCPEKNGENQSDLSGFWK